MSKLELLALNNMVNSSEAMFDRRHRILHEARKMISRGGLDGFSMRELSKRADVSTRTIYNAFGSKETVVALAIHAYFETFVAHVGFEDGPQTFKGALTRQITSTLRDIDMPHYMQALVRLYFSPTLHPDIRSVLLDLATRSWVLWLDGLKTLGKLGEAVDVSDLIIDLSNIQYSKIHEWVLGTLDDEAFLTKTMSGILLLLIGATRGNARAGVEEMFVQLQSDGAFRKRLLGDARDRITAMERKADRNKPAQQSSARGKRSKVI